MKLRTKWVIGSSVLIIGVSCALLLGMPVKDPAEQIAETLLDGSAPKLPEQLTPELANFVGWYQAMVKDASPEVQAVMKKFDPRFRSGSANRNEGIEQWYPTDEWLQRLLDMGIVIDDYRSYTGYLSRRWLFYHAENDPEELADMKDFYDLDSDASWDQVLNAGIHFGVKLRTHANQAMDADPRVYGGQLSKDGVFIPFRYKTAYVKNNFILKGARVPDWVSQELTNRGHGVPPKREIPKDIDVIYLDEKGQPLGK